MGKAKFIHSLIVMAAALVGFCAVPCAAEKPSPSCHYNVSSWSVARRTTVDHHAIRKNYADVTADERDPAEPRCSICEEDQRQIVPAGLGWPNVGAFRVCAVYQKQIEDALSAIAKSKEFKILTLTGYRPGRTRGPVVDGLRSQLSNHSFGTAIDINAGHNGLYGKCDIHEISMESLRKCKLNVGGTWDPSKRKATSIVPNGVVYKAMSSFFKWGGEIHGNIRDLMHFSITGY